MHKMRISSSRIFWLFADGRTFNFQVGMELCFLPGLGLPSHRPTLSYQKINLCQNNCGKKTSKSAKYRLPLRYKKRPVKIIMYLGLDIIIKLKFTKKI